MAAPQTITIQNSRRLARNLRAISKQYPKEAARALVTTAKRTTTRTRRDTAKEIRIPQKKIKRRFLSFKARRTPRGHSTSSWVGTRGKIPLIELSRARVNAKGVLKAGGRLVQTFPATMPSGHRGHYVRKRNSKHKKRADGQWTELPIQEPVLDLAPIAKPHLRRNADEQWREFFPVELRRLVRLRNQRLRAKR